MISMRGKLGFLVLGLALSGCGSTLPDKVDTTSIATNGTGVIVTHVSLAGKVCNKDFIQLAKKQPDGTFSEVHKIERGSFGLPSAGTVVQTAELPAGEYHIVTYFCLQGNLITQATSDYKFTGLLLSEKRVWEGSYASFTVNPGEITSIGRLDLKLVGLKRGGRGRLTGRYSATVSPLNDVQRAAFARKRPKLAAAMVERLMIRSASRSDSGYLDVPGCQSLRKPADPEKLQAWELVCKRD